MWVDGSRTIVNPRDASSFLRGKAPAYEPIADSGDWLERDHQVNIKEPAREIAAHLLQLSRATLLCNGSARIARMAFAD